MVHINRIFGSLTADYGIDPWFKVDVGHGGGRSKTDSDKEAPMADHNRHEAIHDSHGYSLIRLQPRCNSISSIRRSYSARFEELIGIFCNEHWNTDMW